MKDQFIPFKAEMIRALLRVENPKTQTRRLNLEKQYFVGQRLWVKENWQTGSKLDQLNSTQIMHSAQECGYVKDPYSPLFFPATKTYLQWCEDDFENFGQWGRVRTARFMPRWASRITLEVTAVREEHLQDITVGDCFEEGIPHDFDPHDPKGSAKRVLAAYEALWILINGPGSWNENPVVKVISFKVVKP